MTERQELELRRRRFEDRLAEVREALGREVGWVPRGIGWVLPLAAAAAGLAAALALRKALIDPSRRGGRELDEGSSSQRGA